MIYLPFIYYYLGVFSPIVFIIYFFFITKKNVFNNSEILIILLLLIHFIRVLILNQFPESLNIIRYFWGFYFFYLYFKTVNFEFSKKILLFFVITTILETILINTVLSASNLPNFPDADEAWSHFAPIGSYQRPYGFGGNATVLSVILVLFYFLYNFSFVEKVFLFLSIILAASGTGAFALALYLINKFKWYYGLLILFITSIFIYSGIFGKISYDYIKEIYLYKIFQINNEFSISALIWGTDIKNAERQLGGDFSFLSFLEYNGIIGLLILFIIIFYKLNDKNRTPILILVLCSLHYGVVFSIPGQLVFAYFLSRKDTPNLHLN
jgi:hypothetical protein